jgi:hypothetical protein
MAYLSVQVLILSLDAHIVSSLKRDVVQPPAAMPTHGHWRCPANIATKSFRVLQIPNLVKSEATHKIKK